MGKQEWNNSVFPITGVTLLEELTSPENVVTIKKCMGFKFNTTIT